MLRRLREMPGVYIYQGSSKENTALSAAYAEVLARYRGTRKERQEVFGEFLEDNPGALDGWSLENFAALRVEKAPPLRRCYVGIDPAVTSHETSDETGIVAVGQGEDRHAYILADSSGRHQPQTWARLAVALYRQLRADSIIAEGNNGGDLVSAVIANVDANVPVKIVHASRGKAVRAEPVSLWFHQRRAHMVGRFPELERELASFDADLWEQGRQASPGRLDAMVWAFNPFVEGPSDVFGLVDFLAGIASGAIPDPTKVPSGLDRVQPRKPQASEDARICPACGTEGLMQKIAGGQLRCGQCGAQFGVAKRAALPESWFRRSV
jgi:phage terminase large subunit-like protein